MKIINQQCPRGGVPVQLRRRAAMRRRRSDTRGRRVTVKPGSRLREGRDGEMLQGASIAASGLPGPRFAAQPPMATVARTAESRRSATTDLRARGQSALRAMAVDAALVQHWRQAAGHQIEQLQQGVAAILTRSDAAVAVLDFLPFGIILVDGESTALLVNRRAEQILSEHDGLGTQGGKLSAARPTDTTRLRQMIARTWHLAHGPGPHPSDGLQLARPSGRRPLVIRIVPLKTQDRGLGGPDLRSGDPNAGRAAACCTSSIG